jgi:hypothetical protein
LSVAITIGHQSMVSEFLITKRLAHRLIRKVSHFCAMLVTDARPLTATDQKVNNGLGGVRKK